MNKENKTEILISMLNKILKKQESQWFNYETRASIILAFSASIFVLIAKDLFENNNHHLKISIVVFAFTLLIVIILSLLTIRPLKFLRKKNQEESLMYAGRIKKMGKEKYTQELIKMTGNKEKIIEEYAMEIYNLVTYAIAPRKKMFRMIIPTIIIGLSLGLSLSLLGF